MRLEAAAENKLPTVHDKAASAAKSSACTVRQAQLPASFMRLTKMEPVDLAPML